MTPYKNLAQMHTLDELFGMAGKVVVIFGGGGKMGLSFSKVLSLAGAKVIISDKALTPAIEDEITRYDQNPPSFLPCDVTNERDISACLKKIFDKWERIDALVYNVMAKPEGYYKKNNDYPLSTWKKVIDANLTGAFVATKECARLLTKYNQKSSFVLTSSTYGIVGPDQRIYESSTAEGNIYESGDSLCTPAAYSASKAAFLIVFC